jgi:hypothetical protein
MLRLDRLLLLGGILSPVQFTGVYLVEGATRPGYDPTRHQVSVLSLTDRGRVNGLSIVVNGLLVILLALGLSSAFGKERPAFGRGAWASRGSASSSPGYS